MHSPDFLFLRFFAFFLAILATLHIANVFLVRLFYQMIYAQQVLVIAQPECNMPYIALEQYNARGPQAPRALCHPVQYTVNVEIFDGCLISFFSSIFFVLGFFSSLDSMHEIKYIRGCTCTW